MNHSNVQDHSATDIHHSSSTTNHLMNPDNTVFSIPKQSFTAFRMKYGTPDEISRTLTTVLLGGVPESWIVSKQLLVSKISRRKKVLNKLKSFNAEVIDLTYNSTRRHSLPLHRSKHDELERVKGKVTFSYPEFDSSSDSESDSSIEAEDSLLESDPRNGSSASSTNLNVVSNRDQDKAKEGPKNNDSNASESSSIDFLNQGNIDSMVRSLYDQIYETQYEKSQHYSLSSPFLFTNKLRISLLGEDIDQNDDEDPDHVSIYYDPPSSISSISSDPPEITFELSSNLRTTESSVDPLNGPLPKHLSFSVSNSDLLRVQSTTSLRRKSRNSIKKMVPDPVTNGADVIESYSPVEPSHVKAMKRLKKSVFRSRLRIQQELDAVEKRLRIKSLLRTFEVGEVLMLEKMLVLVKESVDKSCTSAPLNEMEETDTRVTERWKEYIVVVRSNSDPDNPVYIQFENQRHIDKNKDFKLHGIDFKVNLETTKVNFYSKLDKTICVSVPHRKSTHGRVYYIFRTHTVTSAVSWYKFFLDIFSQNFHNSVSLGIPLIDLELDIVLPWEVFDGDEDSHFEATEPVVTVTYNKSNGYHLMRSKQLEYIVRLVEKKLHSSKSLHSKWIHFKEIRDSLCLCWKDSNRIEWIPHYRQFNLGFLRSFTSSHKLELRCPMQYPNYAFVTHLSQEKLYEPVPVEGFMARLTSRSGHRKSTILRRQIFKFEYYFSHDNLLMFCSARNGIPPLPDITLVDRVGHVSDVKRLRSTISQMSPLVYENCCFKLDRNKHFEWLQPGINETEFRNHDISAFRESERRFSQIAIAKGAIDLCEVEEIRSVSSSDTPLTIKSASTLLWTGSISCKDPEFSDGCFEIRLLSGAVVLFQAPNLSVKKEWIYRLESLSRYWKLRKTQDMRLLINLKESKSSEGNDSFNLNYFKRAQDERTKFSSLNFVSIGSIYNISDVSLSRTILMSGILYQKPKKHTLFRKYFALLTAGNIILFKMFKRSRSGSIKTSTGYKHYMTIPIHEAYVYSGTSSSMNLLESESGVDHSHPTYHLQPKIYEDGLLSCDQQRDRCFTLWFGTKRAIAGSKHHSTRVSQSLSDSLDNSPFSEKYQSSTVNNPGVVRLVSRLGVTGNSVVFITKSREERDVWVTRIANNIEKFFTPDYDEIKLT